MDNLIELSDTALDYENDMIQSINTVSDYRVKMIDRRNIDILKSIIPILDILIYEAQQYKDWLEEIK